MKRWHYVVVVVVSMALTLGSTAYAVSPGVWLQTHAPYGPTNTDDHFDMPCGSRDSIAKFVVTFSPQADIPDFVATDMLFTLSGGDPYDPMDPGPFWRFEPGGCNELGLGGSIVPPADIGNVINLWDEPTSGVATAAAQNGPYAERMGAVTYRPTPIALRKGVLYYAGTLTMAMCSAQACAGCSDAAALYMSELRLDGYSGSIASLYGLGVCLNGSYTCNSVRIVAPPWEEVADMFRGLKAKGPRTQMVSECAPVATQKHSWGTLKILYR